MRKILAVPLTLAAALSLGACAGIPDHNPIRMTIAASQSHRPAWVDDPPKPHDGHHYFVGSSSGVDDESLARDEARASALANVGDGIRDQVHHYLDSARTMDSAHAGDYTRDVETAIEDGTLSVSRAVVSGASVDRYYWVLYTDKDPTSPTGHGPVMRDEYALLSLSDADYLRTLKETIDGVQKQVDDPKARHVLNFMKKHFLNDLNK